MIYWLYMRLITWNVNGLRSVQRNAGLDAVLALAPDVLLLQETKLAQIHSGMRLMDIMPRSARLPLPLIGASPLSVGFHQLAS